MNYKAIYLFVQWLLTHYYCYFGTFCSSGTPETYHVVRLTAFTDLPASTSGVLRLKVYPTMSAFICTFCFVSQNRVSLCSPGYPGISSIDRAGLELTSSSASRVLRLKACYHLFLSVGICQDWGVVNFFLSEITYKYMDRGYVEEMNSI